MSSVDNRIVAMKFDNAAFEKGVSVTLGTLDKLKQSLNFSGSAKGLDEVQGKVNNFQGGTMEAAVTGISGKFLALSTIAITALSNITTKAIDAGTQLAKSLTIDPIKAGFDEFELKMGAIQTIMAGSGENLSTVNKYLQELNTYSDKTIYSFKDMTSNIGKFTNAGISLKDSVASIKGVANVAALSGANADEASRAMYNFAQALSQGSVRLQDWKSIELANMGTKEFKQQLIDSAVAAGTLTKGVDGVFTTVGKKKMDLTALKGFNESLSEGWLTTEALTTTLGKYADENTDVGKRATAAAQDVKTFSQMLDTLKESAGSGWATTWELLFGNFEEGKKLWTGLNNFFGGFITRSANARNKILKDWKDLGGRTDLIEGIKNVFSALANIIKPIKEAFRDIFPAMTGKRLAEMTKNFRTFTEGLRLGQTTIDNLRRTFRGIFAVFSIFKTVVTSVIGGVINIFKGLFASTGGAGDGILGVTANIGDFLVKIDSLLKKGGALKTFFGNIGTAIGKAAGAIKQFVEGVATMAAGGGSALLDGLIQKFSTLSPIINFVKEKISQFVNALKNFSTSFNISDLFSGFDAGGATKLVSGGIFAAILLAIRQFIKGLTDSVGSISGVFKNISGTFESASGILEQVTSNLKTMQADVKANIILKIAGALALLAAAIWLLSRVDAGDLAKSLVAVTVMLGLLAGALKVLEKQSSLFGSVKLAVISTALIGLAAALVLMSVAIAILGNMETSTLVKGITAIAAVLGVIIAATALLDKTGGQAKMIATAVAIAALSGSLIVLAGAIKLFAMIDTGTLVSGGAKIAGALLAVNIMMRLMPKNMLVTAAGLIVVATALTILAGALKIMGSMSGGEMAKSLGMLGASLLIIAVALIAMDGAIVGAAAILVFAAALNMLIPPLLVLANLSWAQLGMALLGLVAIFVVLGAAGYLLAPVVVVIIGLGIAVALLGLGALAAGVGILAFAAALTLLATLGAAALVIISAAILQLAALIPAIMAQVALGIVAFVVTIAENTPKILAAFGVMLDAILAFIVTYAPKLYKVVFDLIFEFLKAAKKRIPDIVDAGGDLIAALIKGIGEQDLKIIKAAGDTLLKFLEGLSKWVQDNKQRFHDVGHDLAEAIIEGLVSGITGLGSGVRDALLGVAKDAFQAAKDFFHVGSPSKLMEELGKWVDLGFAGGIDKHSNQVDKSFEDMGDSAVTTMQTTMSRLSDLVSGEMEFNPVIAPVIDLTAVKAGADKMSSMLAAKPLTTDVSFSQAASISAIRQPVSETAASTSENPQIVFEQNNYSPKALSPLEIYRNTRSQISLAKEALAG
jgi:hypothetical protein